MRLDLRGPDVRTLSARGRDGSRAKVDSIETGKGARKFADRRPGPEMITDAGKVTSLAATWAVAAD